MDEATAHLLTRVAEALERMSPAPLHADITQADCFLWNASRKGLVPLPHSDALPLSLLRGIDDARDALLANTHQFAHGFSANNALLWGARGMGKSSLVKAVHAQINQETPHTLVLAEIQWEDLHQLPLLMHYLRDLPRRFIVFCDDLSFDEPLGGYKSLKTALEGGIEGRPDNVLFYATSNSRHLVPREAVENEKASALHAGDLAEENISLSDRFGLWLGFHTCSRDMYFSMVENYARHFGLDVPRDILLQQASFWSHGRGARSGRVAWQFILDLAGRMEKPIPH